MLCGVAVPTVTYDGVGAVRSVPQNFFGMTRPATLLPWLGPGKPSLAAFNLLYVL
jgi:hypothetical protein